MTKTYKGLMILGGLLITFGIYFVYLALASNSWNQVDGTIINTRIPASLSTSSGATQRRLVYRVEVTYKYQVDGISYTNTKFSNGTGHTVKGGFTEKSEAREWLKNSDYSTGKKVTVYVNPKDTKMTVLSSGINIGTIMPILLGLLFFLLGYALNKYIPSPPQSQ